MWICWIVFVSVLSRWQELDGDFQIQKNALDLSIRVGFWSSSWEWPLFQTVWIGAVKWNLMNWLMGQNLSWRSGDKENKVGRGRKKGNSEEWMMATMMSLVQQRRRKGGSEGKKHKKEVRLQSEHTCIFMCVSEWVLATVTDVDTARGREKGGENRKRRKWEGTGLKQGHNLTSSV